MKTNAGNPTAKIFQYCSDQKITWCQRYLFIDYTKKYDLAKKLGNKKLGPTRT